MSSSIKNASHIQQSQNIKNRGQFEQQDNQNNDEQQQNYQQEKQRNDQNVQQYQENKEESNGLLQLQNNEQNNHKNNKNNNRSSFANQNLSKIQSVDLTDQLSRLQQQLKQAQNKSNSKEINQMKQKIQLLRIKIHIKQKMKTNQQAISIQRLNHLQLIFKHYCTHIFKTGKHMTFQRLQYQKVHLTMDRFFAFLKDFNLTTMKLITQNQKIQRVKQIVQKQQVIKLFKKVSLNCRDLSFQQFIVLIQKIAEVYYDAKINYFDKKQNQRKQKIKLKQQLQRKAKLKQQMIKKHKQKLDKLTQQLKQNNLKQKGQNDDLINQIMQNNEDEQQNNTNLQTKIIDKLSKQKQNINKKIKKVNSKNILTNKNQNFIKYNQKQDFYYLTKQQKIQYFYELINVDNINSFRNKMRQLNLPLFQIYSSHQNLKYKNKIDQNQFHSQNGQTQQKDQITNIQNSRIKQLRQKINQRNQILKKQKGPNLSKQQYLKRKLERSRQIQQQPSIKRNVKNSSKNKKIDVTDSQINLQSLNKLALEATNLNSKFNPTLLYSKDQDDDIFLKQYMDNPVKKQSTQNQIKNPAQNLAPYHITKASSKSVFEKDRSSQSFLKKLKQRSNQVQLDQKNHQISQMYRFKDRTQRQKRLIDKFLQKTNK